MKKLILPLLLFYTVSLNAQVLWDNVLDSNNKSTTIQSAIFQDSILVTSGFVSLASCPGYKLFAHNLEGEQLWSIPGEFQLLNVQSDYIYTAGFTVVDDIPSTQEFVFAKYNNRGKEIYRRAFPVYASYFKREKPSHLTISPNGTYVVCLDSTILKFNENDEELKEIYLKTESALLAVEFFNPSQCFLSTADSIYRTNDNFGLSFGVGLQDGVKKIEVFNDTLLVLTDKRIVRFDLNLNLLDTLYEDQAELQDFKIFDNEVWIQKERKTLIELIKLRKGIITLVGGHPISMTGSNFFIADNMTIFTGNSFSGQMGNFAATLKNTETTTTPDVELLDFDISNIRFEYYDGDTFAMGYNFDAEFEIKNNGTSTINSAALFAELEGGMNCARNFFYKKYDDLNIAPGATVTVTRESIYQQGISNNNLCFELLAPNSALELNIENNSKCKSFKITSVEHRSPIEFSTYPNPFKDYLIIENLPKGVESVSVLTLDGKFIETNQTNSGSLKIDTRNLGKGAYLIRIEALNNISTRLVFKR